MYCKFALHLYGKINVMETRNTYQVNIKVMILVGWWLMVIGMAFAIIETHHFNSTYLPKTKDEFICDYIATFISGSGGSLFIYSLAIKMVSKIKQIKNIG